MQAFQLVAPLSAPELRDVPVPEPGPGEVLVRVGGAGACHSDIHLMDEPIRWDVPFTLGHENAGWVAARGAGVDDVDDGEAVAVYGAWGCGRCAPCLAGAETRCERAREIWTLGGGLGRDGGMAEYLLVPSSRHLVPLGDLDPVLAAPLTDAALTPYHAIRMAHAHTRPDATVVVIGIGGLGHMAVQLLRATTAARIVAVDSAPGRLAAARALGADEAILAGPDAAAEVRALTRGVGADAVLDLVGAQPTIDLAAAAVRVGGHLAIVGLGGGTLAVHWDRVPKETTLVLPYWGTRDELREVLALAAAGRIRAAVETFALADAHEAYRRMREGTLEGRAVITPGVPAGGVRRPG